MSEIIEITVSAGVMQLYETTANNLVMQHKHLARIDGLLKQMEVGKNLVKGTTGAIPFHEYELVIKYNGLLNISILDLAVIVRQLYIAKLEWEKLFFSKQGYALIYETVYTHNSFNRKLHKLLSDKPTAPLTQYNLIIDDLKAFKVKYGFDSTIRTIRNKVAAHVEEFTSYYNVINTIDTKVALEAMRDFLEILDRLQKITVALSKVFETELNV